jgi:hypothetical protein
MPEAGAAGFDPSGPIGSQSVVLNNFQPNEIIDKIQHDA